MSKNLPGRPDHPDFWLISEAVLDMDAQAEAGQDTSEILGRMISPDAATYAAIQRAQRAAAKLGMSADPDYVAGFAGAWIDGLMTGMRVQQAKTKNSKD